MPLLPLLAINAIAMMAAALGLAGLGSWPPQAAAHVAFALGILPLILAAMAYFIPVLTRSGSGAPPWLHAVPLGAWLGGVCMVAGFTGYLGFAGTSHAAFLLAGAAAVAMLAWTWRRGQRAVGKPHPGLNWYLAALACLVLALLAVPLMSVWPAQHAALRLFHLHLNLLGFVGLTALGTLQVLVPTAAGRPDARAAQRLAGDLKFAFSGVLLLALGAAWLKPLALLGAALYLVAPLRMALHWRHDYADLICRRHGATSSLALACAGLLGLLVLGIGHALGLLAGRDAIGAFVLAFLLPLVSGAATQLLPVWLRPGPQREWHAQVRTALGWLAGVRALLMVAGGLCLALGWTQGLWLALAGLALLVLGTLRGLSMKLR